MSAMFLDALGQPVVRAQVNSAASESGLEPLEYFLSDGFDAGDKLALTKIEMRRVDTVCIDGDSATDVEEEDSEGDDDSDDDQDSEDDGGDDGDDDDDDDDGGDDGDDDEDEDD